MEKAGSWKPMSFHPRSSTTTTRMLGRSRPSREASIAAAAAALAARSLNSVVPEIVAALHLDVDPSNILASSEVTNQHEEAINIVTVVLVSHFGAKISFSSRL